MKRSAILATVAFGAAVQAPVQAAPAAAAAPAAVAAPAAPVYAPAPAIEAATSPAPLAPVSASLLQNHPGAPTGIEDVLLVPSASAGQKAAAFQWGGTQAEGYVLWNKFFAAAQHTGGTNPDAQTLASFGLMTSKYGAGLSIATRDTTNEDAQGSKETTTRALTQLKLFGSMSLGHDFDAYASVQRLLLDDYDVDDNGDETYHPAPRHELFQLQVGARKYPDAGVEGLAWNAYTNLGMEYDREAVSPTNRAKNNSALLASVAGQVGYVLISEGVTLLPGADAYVDYANGPENPDYSLAVGVRPYVAIILPLFEHWTLKGGVGYAFEQTLVDNLKGDPSVFADHQLITGTSGNFGLRYEHKRWAVEAQIGNQLITKGTSSLFDGTTGNLFSSLALTVGL